jgi:hypothetical protein
MPGEIENVEMKLRPAYLVFDDYRSARLGRRYYEYRLQSSRRYALAADAMILICSSSVLVGLLAGTAFGAVVAKVFAGIAALVSIYQLVAKPGAEAAAFEAHVAVFEQLDESLGTLMRRVKAGNWDASILDLSEQAHASARGVHLQRVEGSRDEKTMNRAYEAVNREIPSTFFA